MGKVSKVRGVPRAPDKVLDSPGNVRTGESTIWPEDLGVRIDVRSSEATKGRTNCILQAAIDAVLQAIEEAGLSVSVSGRHGAADGRHATFSCAAARIETIECALEGRSFRVGGGWVPQDEPVEDEAEP